MDDPFISNYIEDLLKNIRTQVSATSPLSHRDTSSIPFLCVQAIRSHHFKDMKLQLDQYPICSQVVLKLIQPYTRIRIPFVSQQLNIPEADVEQLLVSLILDNRINGHIDQVSASRPPHGGNALTQPCLPVLVLAWTLPDEAPTSPTGN